jgi:hypothetical protein
MRNSNALDSTDEQQPDTAPGNYFVSIVRDAGSKSRKVGLLLGPFVNDHATALANVRIARSLAEAADPRAVWDSFGTVRLPADYTTPGVLNDRLTSTKKGTSS